MLGVSLNAVSNWHTGRTGVSPRYRKAVLELYTKRGGRPEDVHLVPELPLETTSKRKVAQADRGTAKSRDPMADAVRLLGTIVEKLERTEELIMRVNVLEQDFEALDRKVYEMQLQMNHAASIVPLAGTRKVVCAPLSEIKTRECAG